MSYGQTALTQCEDLQDNLDNFFSTCSASDMREPTPWLDFLLSPINNTGLEQVVVQGSKIREINLRYFQRINEDNVAEDATNPQCSATTKRGDCSESYTLDEDDNLQIEEKIELKDLIRVCRDNGDYMTKVVNRLIDVLARRVATKTMTEAAVLTGAYDSIVNGVAADVLSVRTLTTPTSSDVYPWAAQEIDTALMQTGYCDTPFIFSDVLLWQYMDRVNAGCCANQGVDLGAIARQFGKVVQYDRRLAAAFGANKAIVTQPRANTLLQYAFNDVYAEAGVANIIGAGTSSRHMVVFDPQSGLKMDLNVTEEPCGGINFVLTATTKLVSLPTDIFGTGDSKDGVKFFNEILVDNS